MRPTSTTRYSLRSRLAVAAAVSVAALLAGGCASTAAYPEQSAWRLTPAQSAHVEAVDQAAPVAGDSEYSAEKQYVYRGGRDPKTGRAYIQM